jgi:hypothetical protein
MIVFFMIVYSVPFFTETTYMSAIKRFEPFMATLKQIERNGNRSDFVRAVTMFISDQMKR